MLQSMRSQRVGHNLVTEQQQSANIAFLGRTQSGARVASLRKGDSVAL